MVQQDYNIGEETTLSTGNQLATADSKWNWEGRTLIGLTKEDGTVIDPGGTTVFDTERATVSGLWRLNKTTHPIKIYALGSSGQISVDIVELNTSKPLADSSHPYVKEQNFVLNPGEDISAEIFFQKYQAIGDQRDAGDLSIIMSPSEGTTIKAVKNSGYTVIAHTGMNIISGYGWDNSGSNMTMFWVNNSQVFGGPSQLYPGISVDFVQGGVLEYAPNKDALNPNHPDIGA